VAEDDSDRLPALAADLVERQVSVIARFSNFAAAVAARGATRTNPIVFVMGADPLSSRIVTNLARPEGNMTGVTLLTYELIPKTLSLLREVVPASTRIGFIVNYSNPGTRDFVETFVIRVRALGVELLPVNIGNQTEIDERFDGPYQAASRCNIGWPRCILVGAARPPGRAVAYQRSTSRATLLIADIG
jgi:putative tryptophan/tyrosine transport system substrate-binding protein